MHSLERRYHYIPVKEDKRKPSLSLVKQTPHRGDIMSNTIQYLFNLAPAGVIFCVTIGYLLGKWIG